MMDTSITVSLLGVVFILTLAWPATVPLMALAYKLRIGSQPIPLSAGEYWLRSTLVSLALAGVSLIFFLTYILTSSASDEPIFFSIDRAMMVLLLYLFLYFPLACYLTFYIYAMDEPIEGLSVFSLFLLLPGLPLFFTLWKTDLWKMLS